MTALITLASIDPRHLTPAHTLGRAVIEQGLRIQWLLEPDAVAERELRWLAFKGEEARLYRGSAGFDDLVAQEEERVRDAEERTGQKVPGVPRVVDLADQFSPQRSLYQLYRLLSQTTHGTAFGAGTFHVDARVAWRKKGGTGEWLEAEFWAVPLVACRDALVGALIAYRDRFAPDGPLPSLEDEREFRATIGRVPANSQAQEAARLRRVPLARPVPTMNRAQRRAARRRRGQR